MSWRERPLKLLEVYQCCCLTTEPSFPFWLAERNCVATDAYQTNIHQRTQASVWVSFCEIYNEYVYDLLSVLSTLKNQKRRVLRICEDQGGNSYIKGNNTIL